MKMTLVTYRTLMFGTTYNQYAVIPTCWLLDLTYWLTLSEEAEILSTDNNPAFTDPILPINWPSYQTCRDAMVVSDLVTSDR